MTTTPEDVDGLTVLDPVYAALADLPVLPVSHESLDDARDMLVAFAADYTPCGQVELTDHTLELPDGHLLRLRVSRPRDAVGARPCVYGIHGGGYVMGNHQMLDSVFDGWCGRLGIVGVSVEYRLAPEHAYPTPLDDCYAGLEWVSAHHAELGIDPALLGVQGTSAGGGLAAALALLARDRGVVPLAFQILECPMLDDRFETQSSTLDRLLMWPRESNEFGWRAYLADHYGRDDLTYHAAAARADDLRGLPPAIVCVGGADGFRDEDVIYASRLAQAGVPTELHVYPGAPHGAHAMEFAPAAQQWARDVEHWLARIVTQTSPALGPTPELVDGLSLLDPVFVEPLAAIQLPIPDRESLPARRETMRAFTSRFTPSDGVTTTDHTTTAADGHDVVLRVYRPVGFDGLLPCIYAMHGGGYIVGSYDAMGVVFDRLCPQLGVVGVSVEYRLAPEHPYPAPLDDCFAGLVWVHEHSEELRIDPARIGIQGTSAGGGLAAALALLNRDRGAVPLAFQVLECPMLDDRFLTTSSNLDRLQVWSREANEFGWRSYLGGRYGTDDVPHYAAAARADDLTRLPPTIVCVGGADGFRDENVLYALRLCQAGVPTELHVYPGAPHGVQLVPDSHAAQQWARDIAYWFARQIGSPLPER